MKRNDVVRTKLGDIGVIDHSHHHDRSYDWWVAFHVPGQKEPVLEPYRESELTVIVVLRDLLTKVIPWSEKVFGPGKRTEGICKHIEEELKEVREKPENVEEWIDVVILALDGAWRAGFTAEQVEAALIAKYEKNFKREWPVPGPEDEPIFHKKGIHD
jgi:hypothetical protein